MTIQVFREDEVARVYKYKLIYSMIKYEHQNDDVRDFFKDKYYTAANLCNTSFDCNEYDEIVSTLDKEKEKYDEIAANNQETIDRVAEAISENLVKEVEKLPNDLEKCKFLFEYLLKTFKYNISAKKYHRNVPFGEDYNFEFYHGIPISKTYKGLLVTKTGLSEDIANLFIYLGNKIGLNIGQVNCECNDDSYTVNTVNIDGNISYMDVSSVLLGRCSIDQACLVDRSNLLNYARFNYVYDEGVTQNIDFSSHYYFDDILNFERSIMPDVEFIENNIYIK